MTTFRDIASSETDPEAWITAALMKALDSNLDAVCEGAPGAPRISGSQAPVVQTNALYDQAVTYAKIADANIGHVKLNMATASASYSFGSGGGNLNVSLNPLSFFPSHNGTNATIFIEGGGASADLPAVRINASGAATGAIYWRYIQP